MDSLFHRNSLMPRLTAVACALCITAFIGLQLGRDETWAQSARWGYYPPDAIWQGQPWALLTSVFVHLELLHFAFNFYWLWVLGNALENAIGAWKWLMFFVAAAWVSSALQLLGSGDAGIGMSGVVYAMFGFAWIARPKVPELASLINDQLVKTFMIWLVACAILTQLGLLNIGNIAHAAGLAFGAAVAAIWIFPKRKWAGIAAVTALLALSAAPLFWCPLSPSWTSLQAGRAHQRRDFSTALYWYERSIARGGDEKWALSNMAIIYGSQNNAKSYAQTLKRLRRVDAKAAAEFEAEGGPTD